MQEIKQTIAMCLLMAAFWGFMYPQFSLLQETYTCEDQTADPKKDFRAILEADRGQIVIKSKLWELLKDDENKSVTEMTEWSFYDHFGRKEAE